jgi:hypothetical protein
MGRSRGGSTGAVRAGDDDGRKKKGGLWWLWALLALLLIGLLLFFFLRGGDDKKGEQAASGTATTQAPASTPTPVQATGASDSGTLVAADTSLLPAAETADASSTVGKTATGTGVTVQEIVKGQGFWVGTSQTDRRYVELGGDVGQDEQPGSDLKLKVGDKVNLTGEVRPAPKDPAQTLNLDDIGAQTVKDQGVFVNADKVEAAK